MNEFTVFYLVLTITGIPGQHYVGPMSEQDCRDEKKSLILLHEWAKYTDCRRSIGLRLCSVEGRGDLFQTCPIFEDEQK